MVIIDHEIAGIDNRRQPSMRETRSSGRDLTRSNPSGY